MNVWKGIVVMLIFIGVIYEVSGSVIFENFACEKIESTKESYVMYWCVRICLRVIYGVFGSVSSLRTCMSKD